jgi:hypothetical protein
MSDATRLFVEVLVALLGAGGISGGIIALLKFPSDRRKTTSEAQGAEAGAVEAVSRAAATLVNPLTAQIAEMNRQLIIANQKVADLQARLDEERAISQHSIHLLTQENNELQERVRVLEARLK